MNKHIILVLSIVLVAAVGLNGCSLSNNGSGDLKNKNKINKDSSPSEVVEIFLDAVKADDTDTIKDIYLGDEELITYEYLPNFRNEKGFDETIETIDKQLSEFDYKVKKEKIKGKKASCQVNITTYNMERAMNDFYDKYEEKKAELRAERAKLGKIKKGKFRELARKQFRESLSKVDKDYKKDIKIKLVKKKGIWKIKAFKEDDEFFNVITGGFDKAVSTNENDINIEE